MTAAEGAPKKKDRMRPGVRACFEASTEEHREALEDLAKL